jgi:tetratricopeptide (TPR) repeat protein
MLTRGGRWPDAQDSLAEMIRLDPDGPMTYAAQARIAAHSGEAEQAAKLLLRAIKMAPHTTQLYASLGNIYAQQGKWTLARKCYQNALDYSAYEYDAQAASHGAAFMGAMECKEKGDWEGVLTNCDKAIQIRPDYVEAYLGRGSAKQVQGDFDGALADYSRAIDLQPDLARAYLGRGTQEYAKGDLDSALADYSKAVQLDSKMGPAWKMLGWIHYNRHQFAEALTGFRKACDSEPADDHAHFRIWLARSRLEETVEATKELQAYLDGRQAGSPEDWSSKIGNFLAGRTTEAEFLKAAQSAAQKPDPEHPDAWFYAATKQLILGNEAVATSYFKKCIAAHNKMLLEYESAVAELRFLEEPQIKGSPRVNP